MKRVALLGYNEGVSSSALEFLVCHISANASQSSSTVAVVRRNETSWDGEVPVWQAWMRSVAFCKAVATIAALA
eukprot:CAMPEP_0119324924 /NCGR_PEP_ID=MMETSP1333-20130426/64528_1 /TAXON_ID=418940 /ORGANISM="Scyphosphaera apsteinii, Strain RCC1455" /LENGTH=73 /DNA_ID=CAMNT_0007332759 /DNA_START=286 /DNA_END=503 /DNA_ORIENTATION=-